MGILWYHKISNNSISTCSGWIPHQDNNTCPAASEASHKTKGFDVPVGPVEAQGESLESCPEPILDPSYLHGSATIRSLFRDHICPESCSRKLNLGEAILLVGGPNLHNEDPLWRSSLLHWLELSYIILTIHGFSYVARSSPHSKRYNALIQYELFWTEADISAWQSQQSSGDI